mmetsp:Transcript_6160/g.15280  ORF Transcript_6160/g.15280 Transcript_6160/m.15280 type:complete len:334 (+) Transcript_6160:121-1122(+)
MSRVGLRVWLENHVGVEVPPPERPVHHNAAWDGAQKLHDLSKLVVVPLAGEKCLAGEELVECARKSKRVRCGRWLAAEDDLGGPVKPAHKVGADLDVINLYRSAKVAELDDALAFVYQDIVRLDVQMKDPTSVHVAQPQQQLLRKRAHHRQRHTPAVRLCPKHLTEVIPHALKNQTLVPTEGKRGEHSDDMPLALAGGILQLLEYLNLLLSSLPHQIVRPHHLNSHHGVVVREVHRLCLDDVRINPLATRPLRYQVAFAYQLPNGGNVIAVRVVPRCTRSSGRFSQSSVQGTDRPGRGARAVQCNSGVRTRIEHVAAFILLTVALPLTIQTSI